jgi:hypothetical protein
VRLARADSIEHMVVDIENQTLGATVAFTLLLVPAANDREGVQDDAGHGITQRLEMALQLRTFLD